MTAAERYEEYEAEWDRLGKTETERAAVAYMPTQPGPISDMVHAAFVAGAEWAAARRVAPDRETRANIEQIIHMMTEAEWGTYWINTMRGLLEPLAGDDMVTGRDHLLDDAEGPRQDTEPSEPWQDPEPWVSPDGKRWHRQAMSDEKHKPRSRAVYDAETKGEKP